MRLGSIYLFDGWTALVVVPRAAGAPQPLLCSGDGYDLVRDPSTPAWCDRSSGAAAGFPDSKNTSKKHLPSGTFGRRIRQIAFGPSHCLPHSVCAARNGGAENSSKTLLQRGTFGRNMRFLGDVERRAAKAGSRESNQ